MPVNTDGTNPTVSPERYFLVGPEKQVIVINRALFDAMARYMKPNKRFGRVEITFKNGGICGIVSTEHLI
jgi:hypothetical protein